MNPEKMRTSYAKLIYLLEDSICPDVQVISFLTLLLNRKKELLGFSLYKPIVTVHNFLAERNGLVQTCFYRFLIVQGSSY